MKPEQIISSTFPIHQISYSTWTVTLNLPIYSPKYKNNAVRNIIRKYIKNSNRWTTMDLNVVFTNQKPNAVICWIFNKPAYLLGRIINGKQRMTNGQSDQSTDSEYDSTRRTHNIRPSLWISGLLMNKWNHALTEDKILSGFVTTDFFWQKPFLVYRCSNKMEETIHPKLELHNNKQ